MITPRQAAINNRETRYSTGKACLNGHMAERLVSNRSCVECCNTKLRKKYAENKAPGRAKCKRWRDKNKGYNCSRAAAWRAENPEKQKNCDRAWRKNNPEKSRIKGRRRKAAKRGAPGSHTAQDIDDILKLQNGHCAYCRADLEKTGRHIDHITPLARGGGNGRNNLQALCPPCNVTKGTKDPVAFAQSLGLLL